jgi:phosphatidylethanolamine/phosphatidyl-N-methylethanolamine N-methyltransferase
MSYVDFAWALFNNLRCVSAPTPSSKALARAIAQEVDLRTPGLVVELGPGTGAVTSALIVRGIHPVRILAIEQDEELAKIVRENFPGVRVLCGDALAFEQYLPAGERVAAVVSGLPLLNFDLSVRRSLLKRALDCQGAWGRFIQLSYSWRAPVLLNDRRLRPKGRLVWRTFPPAHIWTYRAA